MWYFWRVVQNTRRNVTRNERIGEEVKLNKALPEVIEEYQFKSFEYAFRIAEEKEVKQVMEMRDEGRMRRRWPNIKWENAIKNICQQRGKQWQRWKEKRRDRENGWNGRRETESTLNSRRNRRRRSAVRLKLPSWLLNNTVSYSEPGRSWRRPRSILWNNYSTISLWGWDRTGLSIFSHEGGVEVEPKEIICTCELHQHQIFSLKVHINLH